MKEILDSKVDWSYLRNNVELNKASRNELNQALKVIENLHKKISHLSMIQVEIARSILPNSGSSTVPQETAQTKIAIRNYLLK